MLIFDELRKNDPQLRLLAVAVTAGLFILLAGLWWVQVVSAHEFQNQLETQAYRTVRVPAMRGKILDREGRVLAENHARYNLSLYFDDLKKQFDAAYKPLHDQALVAQQQAIAARERQLHRSLTKAERKQFSLSDAQIAQLQAQARYNVASKVVVQVAQKLGQPLTLDPKDFEKRYNQQRALPYPILKNLDDDQIARIEEGLTNGIGVELDLLPTRFYPFGTTASHLLGYVQSSDESIEGEDSYFDYRLPDYKGIVGIEGGFASQLHGSAGIESMLVNNLGYRQTETIIEPPDAGKNVVTTIDLDIQRAAEEALVAHQGENARGAIVVMDVHTGDVLAMVSSPAIDPNYFPGELPPDEMQKTAEMIANTNLTPEINRATYGSYLPGSIFKPVVALAALENGLDPHEIYMVQPYPGHSKYPSGIKVGTRTIGDTVQPGPCDFKRAIKESSNSYFIYNGMRAGITNVIRIGEKFHFGERENLPTLQDGHGLFPTLQQVSKPDWYPGLSANICFGQGGVNVTPIQIACAYSAIANGGTVLWPRLVEKIEPQDPTSGEPTTTFPAGVVRDHIGVSQRSLQILEGAMMSETEDPDGSGYRAFHISGDPLNWHVCGKTGTAQRENEHNQIVGWNYWFASFAPYENPKYAVVVMVQSDTTTGSGGSICAPIAHDIYEAILKKENGGKIPAIAKN